ncbi:MAG: DUF438 domain-containing protein [Anaerolineae bacterium]|nr:DUF438 domain-containing protein [Anaerolineae bacterium]MDW8070695.1 DUF438 domain-containing protein [Anaerolineae bacterium]
MSEYLNNLAWRKETLKRMIHQLHAGKSVEEVKQDFAALLAEIEPTEIAALEQALIAEGMPAMEIKRLCDVHVAVFREALDVHAARQRPAEADISPSAQAFIARMKAENTAAERTLVALEQAIQAGHWPEARTLLQKLHEHEQHYVHKENGLFPYLEKRGFTGPSTVMWAIHDDIRAGWKQLAALLDDHPQPDQVMPLFQQVARTMREMFYKEENILFPIALRLLTDQEWEALASGETILEKPAAPPREATIPGVQAAAPSADALIPLKIGELTVEQISLLLTHLPVDVTFVDEHDTVRFYSATRERIFDRAPAIIGRKVQQCHPPTSVHRVQRILDDFRHNRRDVAEFWIQLGGPVEQGGRFIHIRYFAVRDAHGAYRGTLEVTQDVTAIRALEGEKRLLDD